MPIRIIFIAFNGNRCNLPGIQISKIHETIRDKSAKYEQNPYQSKVNQELKNHRIANRLIKEYHSIIHVHNVFQTLRTSYLGSVSVNQMQFTIITD